VDPLRPALERRRPIPKGAHDAVGDGEVVLDDLKLRHLGRPLGRREDHPARVRHAQIAPARIDELL
jgi:hypothetical protein